MTKTNPTLDELKNAATLARRASMRVVGTPQEEAMRALALALQNGASIVIRPVLKPGQIVVAEGRTVYVPSEAERDALLAAMKRKDG
jgi:hypothetical protein